MDPGILLGFQHITPAAKGMTKGSNAGEDESFEYHGFPTNDPAKVLNITPRGFESFPAQAIPKFLPELSTCVLFPLLPHGRDPASVIRRVPPGVALPIQARDQRTRLVLGRVGSR